VTTDKGLNAGTKKPKGTCLRDREKLAKVGHGYLYGARHGVPLTTGTSWSSCERKAWQCIALRGQGG